MTHNVNAELISIGTEILLGEITDTNSVHIARALRDIGVNVFYMTSVGDNEGRITAAIELALQRADVVITTGGLGPTVDDMTRQAVASATGRKLEFHQHLLDSIAARFSGLSSNMTQNNARQAYLPEDALLVENPVGTAPCFIVQHQGKLVISLPGVPREMKFLLAERIVPYLREQYRLGVIKAHILRAAGIGESALDDLIGTALLEASNPTVGLAAHSGVVDIRITAKAETEADADAMIHAVADQLYTRVDGYIFGVDDATIEQAVIERLKAVSGKLAISEVGIGEVLVERLAASGADADVLHYSENQPKPKSENVAAEALQVSEDLGQKHAVLASIVILSDPTRDRDKADSEAGTAVVVRVGDQVSSRVYGFGGQTIEARTWTVTWALSRLWRMLGEAGE